MSKIFFFLLHAVFSFDKISIFRKYSFIAYTSSNQFQKMHRKCKYVQKEDLQQCALDGLWTAVQTYNESSLFYPHAKQNIDRALYKGLSEHTIPLNLNRKRRHLDMQTVYLGKDTPYVLSRTVTEPKHIWERIDELDLFAKRILYNKFNYDLDVIMNNNEVARRVGCSKETVRKTIKNVLANLTRDNV